jgi:catechol 2,3-dioxygenase-like lactoylglutathione lyase family enzyme
MSNMATVEIKAFVPARDFAVSRRFYQDLGFTLAWSSDNLAYLRHGHSSFLLQNFYNKEHAGNFMMHLLVEDVEAWWQHVEAQKLTGKYGVTAEPPADRAWGMRDFVIVDPTGVLWRIGTNI